MPDTRECRRTLIGLACGKPITARDTRIGGVSETPTPEAKPARADRVQRLPPRLVPAIYLAAGHAALIIALLTLAIAPDTISGFFYHPRTIALVHLVTLGWISSSILGWIYLVGPVALRTTIPARGPDIVACVLYLVGVAGMVSHFWIDAYSGMVWSAAMVLLGIGQVCWRVLSSLRDARIPQVVVVAVGLAFFNILAAGIWGSLAGLGKLGLNVLPGAVLTSVYAHAHLAAIGWALMMVVGLGGRLLPMILPAAMPPVGAQWACILLLQTGAGALFLSLSLELPAGVALAAAALCLGGVATFVGQVIWMLRNRRPPPKDLRRPDPGTAHALQAIAYLLATAGIGTGLLLLSPSTLELQLIWVYGTFGLLGFLGQIIVGVGSRLLPLIAWTDTFVRTGHPPQPSLNRMPLRPLQHLVLACWSLGVPGLAFGLYSGSARVISASALSLTVAVLLAATNALVVLRRAGSPRPESRVG